MKILFADDMGLMRHLVFDVLTHRGHNVETLTDGDELLERVISEPRTDLIITDNNMIRVNGSDVLWRLRKDPKYESLKSIPVIVYSGDDIRMEVEKMGGIFVHKMSHIDILLTAVDAVAADIAKGKR